MLMLQDASPQRGMLDQESAHESLIGAKFSIFDSNGFLLGKTYFAGSGSPPTCCALCDKCGAFIFGRFFWPRGLVQTLHPEADRHLFSCTLAWAVPGSCEAIQNSHLLWPSCCEV